MFIRYAAYHLQQLGIKKQQEICSSETKKCLEDKEDNKSQIVSAKITEIDTVVESKSNKKTANKDKCVKKGHKGSEEVSPKADEATNNTNDKLDNNVNVEESLKEDNTKVKTLESVIPEVDSEVDTDEAKKIVESITDSISNGDKQESEFYLYSTYSIFYSNIIIIMLYFCSG